MKKTAYLAMGLHFHQPVGNFHDIFQRAYQNCYNPFFKVLADFPAVKMTVHISGCLLDWLGQNQPEFLERLKGLVASGQIEIMGGGYYEPIFSSIPYRDRVGQIKKMTDSLMATFGKEPEGVWIPERVWSPDLVELFGRLNLKYSILDDTHFIKAGLTREKLHGYFLTEYKGSRLAVFPSSKKLRYDIPFKPVRETMDYFSEFAEAGDGPLFIYGDDGEKFGLWPGTGKLVYEEGWLRVFFEELTSKESFLRPVTFSEYLKTRPPIDWIHVPESSYEEMMNWSGGSWSNFLLKYPESDHMHKKMWYVSDKIGGLASRGLNDEAKRLLEEATNELYKGQCNCAYWHGLFGGIYLYHLRQAIYEALVNAEKTADTLIHGNRKIWQEVKKIDFYRNKQAAFVVETPVFSLYVDPEHGGMVRELDYKPRSLNLVNSVRSIRESYHEGIKNLPVSYGRHIKGSLVDHFFDEEATLGEFTHSRHTDSDFAGAPYTAKRIEGGLALARKGLVRGNQIRVTKEIRISPENVINIFYTLKNMSRVPIKTVFGTEFNITMTYLNSSRYHYFSGSSSLGNLDAEGEATGADSFGIRDSEKDLNVEFAFSKKPQDVWFLPVRTVSQSETNFELNYQASTIVPRWLVELNAGKELSLGIKWMVK